MVKDGLERVEKYILKRDINPTDAQYLWDLYHEFVDMNESLVLNEVENLAPKGIKEIFVRNFTYSGRNSMKQMAYVIALDVRDLKARERILREEREEAVEISRELGPRVKNELSDVAGGG